MDNNKSVNNTMDAIKPSATNNVLGIWSTMDPLKIYLSFGMPISLAFFIFFCHITYKHKLNVSNQLKVGIFNLKKVLKSHFRSTSLHGFFAYFYQEFMLHFKCPAILGF